MKPVGQVLHPQHLFCSASPRSVSWHLSLGDVFESAGFSHECKFGILTRLTLQSKKYEE